MSKSAYMEWYKSGSHAVRSACEQGVAAAQNGERLFTDTEAKALAVEVSNMSQRHQEAFVGFLADIGEKPNDFVDQIMKGIEKGVGLSVEAAHEDVIRDVALVTGAQTALHYFIAGFRAHAGAAVELGFPRHSELLETMIGECQEMDRRYSQISTGRVNKAAAA